MFIVILQYNNKDMGISKTQIFSEVQNELATYAKVLGHPARIAILQYLFKLNECVCGDIVNEIGLAQATISQHLKELKNLGLIQGNIDGNRICYCINKEKWTYMKNVLSTFLNTDLNAVKCC